VKPLDIIIPVAIIAVFLVFAFLTTPRSDRQPDDVEAFARCLTENGAKMYGSVQCTHCQDQKDSFGGSWQYVTYVECYSVLGGKTQACMDADINAYPTWEFKDGARKLGFMRFLDLSQASGCPLENSQANKTP